jgi:subtilisin family serine protease
MRGRGSVAVVALVVLTSTTAAQASRLGETPSHDTRSARIANQYIVVLNGHLPDHPTDLSEKKAAAADERVAHSVGAKPLFVYNADIKGFAADLSHAQLRALRHSEWVKFVEPDERVHETAAVNTQTGAPWDLTRIDERTLDLNGIYRYSSAGAGVSIFIIDTGIQASNADFGSRAHFAYNSVDRDDRDCNGHGTHVAGIAGGTKYGVAKLARLVGVKVLNCGGSGTMASVIAGVNWVTEHHVPDKSVANMSLGGGATPALDDAVRHLALSGVFVSVAAGNNNQSACNFSPARAPDAFTVAASDSADRKASFSNHGSCVDAYAPGVAVTSDWIGSPTATNTISGTSMASPVVAGIAALYLADHASTPAATTSWIRENATTGVIANNAADTANLLVYKSDL